MSFYARRQVTRAAAVLSLGAVLMSACSPLALLNASAIARPYRLQADVAFGADTRQKLDVYIPTQPAPQADTVVFFYGGRWQSGKKQDYRFVAQALTAHGLIVVVADYRLYPQVEWREFVADGAAAYAWTQANIAAYGGNPRRIFLMGHSSGAHIAALVALNAAARVPAADDARPCGMIGLAGPYDFLPFKDADIQQIFSSAADPRETQPIHYVDGDDPSLLLLTGDADTVVNPRNAERLAAAMRSRGGNATLIRYAGVGHAGILTSLAPPLRFYAPVRADIVAFVRATACNPP